MWGEQPFALRFSREPVSLKDDERLLSPYWSLLQCALRSNNSGLLLVMCETRAIVLEENTMKTVDIVDKLCIRNGALSERWILLVTETECLFGAVAGPKHRLKNLHYLVSDCDMAVMMIKGKQEQVLLALGGPCGLEMHGVKGKEWVSAWRRSAVAACCFQLPWIGVAFVDGHVSIVEVERVAMAREDEFCAFIPAEQRPTHAAFVSATTFAVTSWDGAVLLVKRAPESHEWQGVQFMRPLSLQTAGRRLNAPSFLLSVPQGDAPLVARGVYLGIRRLCVKGPLLGLARCSEPQRFFVLDQAFNLWQGSFVAAAPDDLEVAPGLSAATALKMMGDILPHDCVVLATDEQLGPRCHWIHVAGKLTIACYDRLLIVSEETAKKRTCTALPQAPDALALSQEHMILIRSSSSWKAFHSDTLEPCSSGDVANLLHSCLSCRCCTSITCSPRLL